MTPQELPAELRSIVSLIEQHTDGIGIVEIQDKLGRPIPRRTLNRRLAQLVEQRLILRRGAGPAAIYLPVRAEVGSGTRDGLVNAKFESPNGEIAIPVSREGLQIREYLARPKANRRPVGYQRQLLDEYQPNNTDCLPEKIRAHLHRIGRPIVVDRPAGTFARDILNRLLIDLSWASSRLEGNTYSRLDTQRLIEFGQAAEGKDATETQMILNHKAAIEMIVTGDEEIGINRYTILNLHALLSQNLMPDPDASGRLRRRPVDISGSLYTPAAVPQLVEECFNLILDKARQIGDPFEQAFFLMVHLPYLQPFEDVNKRVSRLSANIPFVRKNLCPLSFVDVPERAYVEATLGVYEMMRHELLRDLFVWAYERSCERYIVVRDSTAEPDIFRMRYREALIEVVATIVKNQEQPNGETIRRLAENTNVAREDLDRFVDMVSRDFTRLYEGNIAVYRLKPVEFEQWQRAIAVRP